MNKKHELLNNPAYDFLINNENLENMLFLTLSGSYAYGTNVATSDVDLRGVVVESKTHLLGFEDFEQFEDSQTDTVIFGLKKFLQLCLKANPSILELLGTDEDCIVKMTPMGQKLRENIHLFYSKRVINTFGGYATAQLRRIQNAMCHDTIDDELKRQHLATTLNKQLTHFETTYGKLGAFKIYSKDEKLTIDVNVSGYDLTDFLGMQSEISQIVTTYGKLDKRNNKKGDDKLFKHAMHLIRLLLTGTDVLNGLGIKTRRHVEKALLIDIRNGVYSWDEIFEFVAIYQQNFDSAAKSTLLPDAPDIEKVQQLMMDIYEEYL